MPKSYSARRLDGVLPQGVHQASPRDANDGSIAVSDARTLEVLNHRVRGQVRRRGWLVRRALVAADLIGLSLAFTVVEALNTKVWQPTGDPSGEITLFVATLPMWVLVAKLNGLYDQDEERASYSTVDDLIGVFYLVTAGVWVLFAASWALPNLNTIYAGKLVLFWALAITLVALGRTIARGICHRSLAYVQNTVIVGGGDVGQLIGRKLLAHPEYGMHLVGYIDQNPRASRPGAGPMRMLGGPEELCHVVIRYNVERVIFAFSQQAASETLALIRELRRLDVQIDVVPRAFEVVGEKVGFHTVEGLPLLGLPPARPSRSSRAVKRAIDLTGAAAMFVITSPLFLFIAWRVHRDSPGPVIFRQERLGLNAEPFTMLKFRTMAIDTDPNAHREFVTTMKDPRAAPTEAGLYKLPQAAQITPSGHWLRRSSLDELPQLINVLRGEMSLVGPRPCLAYETELFEPHHFDRFLVPPGLTGLWQVTARAHASFGEALEMDVVYARDWSLGLDIRLLLRTPRELLRQRNATS